MPGITMRPAQIEVGRLRSRECFDLHLRADGHDALTAYREGLYKRCEPSLMNTRAFTSTGSAGGG